MNNQEPDLGCLTVFLVALVVLVVTGGSGFFGSIASLIVAVPIIGILFFIGGFIWLALQKPND